MSKKLKNSKTESTSKKIILNKKEDLNKISFTDLKNAKIFDFSGDYFNFIYDKALNIEKNPEEKEPKTRPRAIKFARLIKKGRNGKVSFQAYRKSPTFKRLLIILLKLI